VRRAIALLAALSLLFFAAFFAQRRCSVFLAVESRAADAQAAADASGLSLVDVLALHELAGGDLSAGALAQRAARFVALRAELGHEGLAVLALEGHGQLARRLRAEGGEALDRRIRALPEGIAAVRFAAMRERFAARR
jgi:hypothetical protein